MVDMTTKFSISHRQFTEWNKRTEKLVGFCLWQIEFAGFVLEAWNDNTGQLAIFQIFADGRGFMAYTLDNEYLKED